MGLDLDNRSTKCRSWYACDQFNVCLESLVITLTLVSAIAISGDILITFGYFIVPEEPSDHNITQAKIEQYHEDKDVMDILEGVFKYTSLSIAGIFSLEIFIKICCLRAQCYKSPCQILDSLVVFSTLGVEIAFCFITLPYDTLRAVCYIVLLRLWRIAFVCNIRAYAVEAELEDEIENYRCAKQKAEEKCFRLEGNIAIQTDTIKLLELQLKTYRKTYLKGRQQSPSNIRNNVHGSAPEYLKALNHAGSTPTTPDARERRRRWMKDAEQDSIEMSQINEKNSSIGKSKSTSNIETYFSEGKGKYYVDGEGLTYVKHREDGTPILMRSNLLSYENLHSSKAESLPRSEAINNLSSQRHATSGFAKTQQRKRRSSTSEFIDYSQLDSPCSIYEEAKEKSCSHPSLDQISQDEKDVLDFSSNFRLHEKTADEVDTVKKTDSSSSKGSSGVHSDMSTIEREQGHKPRLRRLTSCPEYVYTQRMSITNDELKLLDGGHAIEDVFLYDNGGFLNDEDVIAEFEGSKTYRNADGIPMTSL